MSWQPLKSWIVPDFDTGGRQPPLEAGMHHYQRPRDDGYMRFHLRVERGGESLLIAGASEAVRLSRDGTAVIKRLLDGEDPQALVDELSSPAAERLVADVQKILEELGSPSARFPIFNLSDPANDPRDADLIAPFQADVDVDDLTLLRSILQKLWAAGIPHVRFLPGAQLSDDDLVQAVEWAEDVGMIAGVRSTGSWLMESSRVDRLAEVGVDYVLSPWAVDADMHARWFGDQDLDCLGELVKRAQELEVTPVVEIPLVAGSIEALDEQWSRFVAWQVVHAEVYALARLNATEIADPGDADDKADAPLAASQLRQLACWVEEVADENAFQVTWLPPVGVTWGEKAADQVRRGPRAGGDVTIRVLANGDVLPPRGALQSAGNLLAIGWDEIWGSPVFRRFRQRVEANTRCQQCPGLAICAADCPADPGGWSHD